MSTIGELYSCVDPSRLMCDEPVRNRMTSTVMFSRIFGVSHTTKHVYDLVKK
jgi:hypothetical protein